EGRSGGTGPGRLLLRLARSTHVGHERLVGEAVPQTVVLDDAVAEIGGLPLESLEAAAQVGEGLGQYFVVAYERRRQVRQPRLVFDDVFDHARRLAAAGVGIDQVGQAGQTRRDEGSFVGKGDPYLDQGGLDGSAAGIDGGDGFQRRHGSPLDAPIVSADQAGDQGRTASNEKRVQARQRGGGTHIHERRGLGGRGGGKIHHGRAVSSDVCPGPGWGSIRCAVSLLKSIRSEGL